MFLILSSTCELAIRLENRDDRPPNVELRFVPPAADQPGYVECDGDVQIRIVFESSTRDAIRRARATDEWALWA